MELSSYASYIRLTDLIWSIITAFWNASPHAYSLIKSLVVCTYILYILYPVAVHISFISSASASAPSIHGSAVQVKSQ